MESLLKIQGGGFPPFSARGCKQELIPIPNGVFKKTINGQLVFLKASEWQRYKTIIKCSDINTPTLGSFSIGQEVEIECIQTIWQRIENNSNKVELIRDYVIDSPIVIDKTCKKYDFDLKGRLLTILADINEQLFVAFRPKLKMLITNFQSYNDEWNLNSSWQLEAEEAEESV